MTGKKIVWFWLVNPNTSDPNETNEWKRYSDFENDFIEEEFQRKKEEVQLNDCIINFQHSIEYKRKDRNQQRPVKREEMNVRLLVREERFSYPPEQVIFERSFGTQFKPEDSFVCQCLQRYGLLLTRNYPAVAKLAAEGRSNFIFNVCLIDLFIK